ncbi:hypothetical protein [Thermodesulfatator autotrophicus]|uniref:hypothetical protein n=1 Tax=Thermodesulfatator autotrophicus TaxID=1795632 RepID=UPI0008397AF4|nr:hypothetical protein [Thermodesulfatator autotrophicus]
MNQWIKKLLCYYSSYMAAAGLAHGGEQDLACSLIKTSCKSSHNNPQKPTRPHGLLVLKLSF